MDFTVLSVNELPLPFPLKLEDEMQFEAGLQLNWCALVTNSVDEAVVAVHDILSKVEGNMVILSDCDELVARRVDGVVEFFETEESVPRERFVSYRGRSGE